MSATRPASGARARHASAGSGRQRAPALAKRVQTYLTRMGMPDRLFKEMMQRASDKTLVLDDAKLKSFGLEGVFPPYEEWTRANNSQRPPQSN